MREKRKTLDNKDEKLKLKKMVQKERWEERGITLIALVVTIIILLILSGVTLNIALSENGLFSKTKEATEKYEQAQEDEEKQLAMADAAMNLDGKEYKSTYNGEDVTIPIPAGFAVSQVEGESRVEDGLVIIDSEGNEFVWIPVTSEDKYVKNLGKLNDSYCNDLTTKVKGDDLGVTSILGENIGSGIQDKPEKNIVVNAGGFYVGRYEAGVEVNENINWEENPKIVVKKNVQPARGLTYEKMLELANRYEVEKSVQSGMMTGTEWDVMCNFIGWNITDEVCEEWANYRNTQSNNYSGYIAAAKKSNGTLSGSNDWTYVENFVKLGINEQTEENIRIFPTGMFITEKGVNTAKKNIFDIAGNVCENTTEVLYVEGEDKGDRVARGGNGWNHSTGRNAATRTAESNIHWSRKDWASGFRIVLYVKK